MDDGIYGENASFCVHDDDKNGDFIFHKFFLALFIFLIVTIWEWSAWLCDDKSLEIYLAEEFDDENNF